LAGERRITIRFNPEFHKRLRIAVADRGIRSIQAAVFQSLEQWLESDTPVSDAATPSPASKLTRKDRELVEALAQILRSSDKVAVAAVQSCLALAEDHVKSRAKK
jgi:hypothetical protein